MKHKKAQGAVGAAILVAVIAVLVILYVLFLPPSEREALFEEYGEEVAEVKENITLLEEFPGRLDYIAQKEIEHSLPAVNLNIFTESKVLKEFDNLYISKSLFGEKKANLSFELENPEDVVVTFIEGWNTQAFGDEAKCLAPEMLGDLSEREYIARRRQCYHEVDGNQIKQVCSKVIDTKISTNLATVVIERIDNVKGRENVREEEYSLRRMGKQWKIIAVKPRN